MSEQTPPAAVPPVAPPPLAGPASAMDRAGPSVGAPGGSRLRSWMTAPVKFALGVLLCQSLLLSLLVVGWTQRFVQRAVYKRWRKASPLRERAAFVALPGETVSPRGPFRALFQAMRLNATLGVQTIFNTWVLTLPAGVAMLFSWAYGWNNSFTKGYEHAATGPAIGLLGVALFIAAMLYVPMAQAHQAVTANWRAFYQWRVVWRIIRCRWLAALLLAALYSLTSIPIMVLRAQPYFFAQMSKASTAELAALTPDQIEQRLNRYFILAGIVVLGGLVLVRWVTARIYAGGVLRALRRGDLPAFALPEEQHRALDQLGHLALPPEPPRHIVLDVAGRVASLLFRLGGVMAAVFLWFTFTAQIYIGQFFNYIPVVGWLNQPLVQLPWIRYVPHEINGELGLGLLAAALALAGFGLRSAAKQLRPRAARS